MCGVSACVIVDVEVREQLGVIPETPLSFPWDRVSVACHFARVVDLELPWFCHPWDCQGTPLWPLVYMGSEDLHSGIPAYLLSFPYTSFPLFTSMHLLSNYWQKMNQEVSCCRYSSEQNGLGLCSGRVIKQLEVKGKENKWK